MPDRSWYYRHRHALLGVAAAAAGGYTAYKVYSSSTNGTLRKINDALANYSKGSLAASSTFAAVLTDLNTYLQSDKDEVPQSVKQLAKLFQAKEVQDSLKTGVTTLVSGVTEQLAATSTKDEDSARGPSALDKIIEAVLSERGRSLVGLAISVASRNSTAIFCEALQNIYKQAAEAPSSSSASSSQSTAMVEILNFMSSDQGERLLSVVIGNFVRNAVGVYVDKTANINYYNDLFSSLAEPAHKQALTEVMSAVTAVFCKELVGTYVSSSSAAASGARQAASSSSRPSTAPSSPARAAASSSTPTVEEPSSPTASAASDINITAAPPATTSEMLGFVVQAYRQQEVRQLVADLTRTGTREFVGSVIHETAGTYLQGSDVKQLMRMAMNKVYVMLSMLLFLGLYATSPRAIMPSP
jgi:hypothetical protein